MVVVITVDMRWGRALHFLHHMVTLIHNTAPQSMDTRAGIHRFQVLFSSNRCGVLYILHQGYQSVSVTVHGLDQFILTYSSILHKVFRYVND